MPNNTLPPTGAALPAFQGNGVPYTVSRHGANLRESAEFPIGVKEALAMCARLSCINRRTMNLDKHDTAIVRIT
jgi:hypothetical protein